MAGAIGMALGRLEPAIDEIAASRIANRPSAGELADFREPHPPHLPNLALRGSPRRLLLLPGFDPAIATEAGGGAPLIGSGLAPSRRLRSMHNRRRPCGRCGAPAAVQLDPYPIRLADHGAAGRRAQRRGDDARASSLERQSFENLDRFFCPQHFGAPMTPRPGIHGRETILTAAILFAGGRMDAEAAIARLFAIKN